LAKRGRPGEHGEKSAWIRFVWWACAVLVVAVAYAVWLYRPDLALRVGTASTSQTRCGEIFVSGLDANRAFAEDVRPKRGMQILLKRLHYAVDWQRQQVVTTWAGHFASVATYRRGYGGTLTMLHSFDSADGYGPEAGVVQATNGIFYGTTPYGGADDYGTVYSFFLGLGSFVETLPAFGKVGTPAHILGTDLTGTTSLTFNGTPATFTVVSKTSIFTNVPAGATTGTVQVVTPSGTLSSSVPFQVD